MISTGVRAHATGVRSLVSVECALVILDRRAMEVRAAIGDRHQAELLADELLLDLHTLMDPQQLPGIVKPFFQRGEVVAVHTNSLTTGQPVWLDDKAAQLTEVGGETGIGSEEPVLRVARDAMAVKQLSRPTL